MMLAVLSFVLLDSTAKLLAQELPVVQLLWARYVISFALLVVLAPWFGWRSLTRTAQPRVQVLRGVLLVCATASVFTGVRYLPVADFYAISFVSPAIVAAIAIPVLGERVGPAKWTAIALGFAGVLIIIRPGAGAFSLAAIFPLAMAMFYACFQVVTRFLGPGESPFATVFYTMLVGTAATSLAVPFQWQTPDLTTALLLFWMGIIGLAGQLLLVGAFRHAQASLLAPLSYTQIVWATIIGYAVFGDIPDLPTVVGSLIVIASGLALTHPRLSAAETPNVTTAAVDPKEPR
jgi:drug/metabolite transporter (DMT)-like permease